jgi:uncharacterized cupredoxin-like copper-binding protein
MRRILVVVSLLALVLVGCGDDSNNTPGGGDAATDTSATETTEGAAETAVLDVTSVDFGYELATDELPAGPVRVNQTNGGDEEHQVTLIRLEGGMTPDDLGTTITEQGDGVLDPDIFAGGTNTIAPGETNTALVNLGPGDYVAYCFLPNHAPRGMIEPFTVTGEALAEPVTVEATATVGLHDFGFDVPEDFDGQGTIEVVNDGDQAHELTIADADDQTGQGGLTTTAPGTTGYVDLNLAPGNYTFVCFVQDPESGDLHLQLGMEQSVTIT